MNHAQGYWDSRDDSEYSPITGISMEAGIATNGPISKPILVLTIHTANGKFRSSVDIEVGVDLVHKMMSACAVAQAEYEVTGRQN